LLYTMRVNENAEYIQSRGSSDVVHRPTQGDLFTCDECGQEAVWKNEKS